jgi:hypothetical protein
MPLVFLWLNPGGEVVVAERAPGKIKHWLPALGRMEPEEAKEVLVLITKAGYYGEHVYSPRVSPDDFEVQEQLNAKAGEAGLLLARFNVDVKRALWYIRHRQVEVPDGDDPELGAGDPTEAEGDTDG